MFQPSPNQKSFQPPKLELRNHSGAASLKLSGEWTVLYLDQAQKQFQSLNNLPRHGQLEIDGAGISDLDTAGAQLLSDMQTRLKAENVSATLKLQGIHAELVKRIGKIDTTLPKAPKPNSLIKFINDTGMFMTTQGREAVNLLNFLGQMLCGLGKSIIQPRRIRWTSLVSHMEQVGVKAVPIVALLAFLIGLVIVYMGAAQLARFGAQVFAVNLLEIATMRELGPLLTAIVVAGRSGSSFTAQIGAMKSNEEISAMRVMGMDPMDMLVLPRVLGLIIMLPLLIIIADFTGLIGGAIAASMTMDLDFPAFLTRLQASANINNFIVGVIKAPFFATAIALVGCYHGYQVTGSAESVGRLTTVSVVQSIFLVIVIDAVFAIFYSAIGV